MTATRRVIDKVEFYITNVCNLTCSNCNRYNNYKFSGWQDWNEYEHIYQKWAEKIDIVKPVILGGEPLLNPTINQWLVGIKRLWPNGFSPQIQSNGTRLDLVPGLYETCRQTNSWVGVSIHRPDDLDPIIKRIKNFLKSPITQTQEENNAHGSYMQFRDINRVEVRVWINDYFIQSNIQHTPDGRYTVYNSDPKKAHDNCEFVRYKNYHFINGKFYKCGPAALMSEFDQQFGLDISDQDREIIHGYRALSVDEYNQRGQEFFDNLDQPIAQCKFCPESYEYRPIYFTDLKNIKI